MTNKPCVIPKRPGVNHPDVLLEASLALAEKLVSSGDFQDNSPAMLASDIVAVARSSMDGYEIGKALDKRGWLVDFNLTEDLDQFASLLFSAKTKAVAKWVQDHNVKPSYSLETPVTWKVPGHVRAGIIKDINEDQAIYYVTRANEGNVHYLVPYEEASLDVAALSQKEASNG